MLMSQKVQEKEPKRRSRMLKAGVAGAACLMLGMCVAVGCSAGTGTTEKTETSGGDASASRMSEWHNAHAAEYYSYLNGGAVATGDVAINGAPVGHANMYESLLASPDAPWYGEGEHLTNACLSCKTSLWNDWAEEEGNDLYYNSSQNYYVDRLAPEDTWDCTLCHDDVNDPAGTLGANGYNWNRFSPTMAKSVDPEIAVCAQCHQGIAQTMEFDLVGVDLDDESFDYNITKYGTDPADMLKRFYEVLGDKLDKVKEYEDEEAGIYNYGLFGYDAYTSFEAFMGSAMQQQGMTCTDCHMTGAVDTAGNEYTSHDASGSPLENQKALEYCLSCHTGDEGVKTTEDVKTWVKGKQDAAQIHIDQVTDELGSFSAAIKDAAKSGSADGASLDEARKVYAEASFYLNRADVAKRVVHNSTGFDSWLNQASAMIEDGMALLV